ncbi:MAG TPA: hypothetical protein VJR06_00060 [Nitrososphaerales archaeon]|nr:hypothetical protein [Nitrososphaerales archaeon]
MPTPVIGASMLAFPGIDSPALRAGRPIPNPESTGIASALVLQTVGAMVFRSLYLGHTETTCSLGGSR